MRCLPLLPAVLLTCLASASPPAQAHGEPESEAEDPTAAVIEQLEAATRRWQQSCPKADATGLCVEVTPAPKAAKAAKAAKGCAAPRLGEIRLRPRKRKLAARAQTELDKAIARAEAMDAPEDPKAREKFRAALSQAHLATVDHDLEKYLAIAMPQDLDFVVEEWKAESNDPKHLEQYDEQVAKKKASMAAFKAYFEAKTKQGKELIQAYARTKKMKNEPALVRAALRTAWVSQQFADEVQSAPVPAAIDTPEKRAAYCGALLDMAEPPQRMARDAARYCSEHASRAKLKTPAAKRCEALLRVLPKDDGKQKAQRTPSK